MKTTKKGKKAFDTQPLGAELKEEILEIPMSTSKAADKTESHTKSGATGRKKSQAKPVEGALRSKESVLAKRKAATSPVKNAKTPKAEPEVTLEAVAKLDAELLPDPPAAMSPVDRLLAQPTLPERQPENRARLQMQSPTKLYFYWSVRENPWAILRKAFGEETGSYTLVLKLVEKRSGSEQIHNARAEGNWWFNVRPDGQYRAEIGFYAPNRPFIRIVHSNIVETPRLRPSPRKAVESDWTVSSQGFAKVLNVAGFARDAFDVAVAGDDPASSALMARQALKQFANGPEEQLADISDEDIRFSLLAFSEGQKLEELRSTISDKLFEYLQASDSRLDKDMAEASLREHFDVDDFELESEETGPVVYGASLLNFPRTAKSRRRPKLDTGYLPESSHNFRPAFE
jgi:hypothetical protein